MSRLPLGLLLALAPVACHDRGAPAIQLVTRQADASVLPAVSSVPHVAPRLRTQVRTVQAAGLARRFLLVAPSSVPAGTKLPLVLYFHGDGGDGEGMHRAIHFEQSSGEAAFVAYPDGVGHTWDLETLDGNKDIAFVEALVADVSSSFPVDTSRVFAAGYSNGGFFANVLACHRSHLVRAIASSAGGAPYHQAEQWPNGFPKCPGQDKVATLALHGENDNGVTLDSGRFTAEYWAYVNGCNMNEMETTAYPECRAYRGCPPGKDVVFCKIPGLGHWVWDKASDVSWAFFQKEGAPGGDPR